MTSKKWLCMFFCTLLALFLLLPIFNLVTDPFGVFGDRFFNWYSYDQTNNPRTAKIAYLDKYHENYDSYIIGCSSTSSFPVETLNKYYNANFYNLIMYGADMLDVEQMTEYIIENYTVKNLVLNVYIDNGAVYDEESNPYTHSMLPKLDGSSPIEFYSRFLFATPEYGIAKIKNKLNDTWLPQSFDVFNEETGAYDKKKRDAEPIVDMDEYLEAYPVFSNYPTGKRTLPETERCMESVSRIVSMCDSAGVNLTVVTAPVYADYLSCFSADDIRDFYSSLAKVVDFWDFSYSSVSFEPRYFYDSTHFRNCVGDMALAYIFDDGDVYIPSDFGYHVNSDNADEYFASYYLDKSAASPSDNECRVPVLMYHHISETAMGDAIVSPGSFEKQIKALADAGYETVSLDELYAFVRNGSSLPEKPVVITFDDGYMSNYDYAYPILKKYGMCGTIFAVGSSFAKDTYKDTGEKMYPHFGYEEAREMIESGVMDIESHTFDMHQSEIFEGENARQTVARLPGESEEDYISALRSDLALSDELICEISGKKVFALAYPQGYYDELSSTVISEHGIKLTFSTDHGVNTVLKGLPQSLFSMKRIWINDDTSSEELLEMIK